MTTQMSFGENQKKIKKRAEPMLSSAYLFRPALTKASHCRPKPDGDKPVVNNATCEAYIDPQAEPSFVAGQSALPKEFSLLRQRLVRLCKPGYPQSRIGKFLQIVVALVHLKSVHQICKYNALFLVFHKLTIEESLTFSKTCQKSFFMVQ